MTLKRKSVVISIFFAVCISSWIGMGLWLRTAGLSHLVRKIEASTGGSLSVGRVRSNLLTNVTLEDVHFSGPASVSIDTMAIRVRPWNLFRWQNRSLFHVLLSNASVSTTRKTSGDRSSPIALPTPLFPVRVQWNHGSFQHNGSETDLFGIEQTEGDFVLSASGAAGVVRVFGGSFNGMTGKIQLQPTDETGWNLAFDVRNAPARSVLQVAGDHVDRYGSVEGPLDIEGHYSFRPSAESAQWSARLKGEKLLYSSTAGKPTTVNADISVDSQKAQINLLTIAESIDLSGEVEAPYSMPTVNLKIIGKNTSIRNVMGIFTNSNVDLTGQTSFSAAVQGSLKRPRINGELTATPAFSTFKFPSIAGKFAFADNEWLIKGNTSGGSFDFFYRNSSENPLSIKIQGIQLRPMLSSLNWENVDGVIDGYFEGNLGRTRQIVGTFEAKGAAWGRYTKTAPVKGRLLLTSESLSVATDTESLSINATIKDSTLHFENSHISFSDRASMRVNGTIDIDRKTMQLGLHAERIPFDLWPPIVQRIKDIEGSFDMDGSLTGDWRSPRIDASMAGHGVQFVKGGELWNGTFELTGETDAYALRKIHIDRGYSGEISTRLKNGRRVWEGRTALLNADPSLLVELTGSSEPIGGVLNGEGTFAVGENWQTVSSSISWTSVRFKNQDFDTLSVRLAMENDDIQFTDLLLVDGHRAVRGNGRLRRAKNNVLYETTLQLQRWGNRYFGFDGEIQSKGRFSFADRSISGKISSTIVWANEWPMENLNVEFNKRGDHWFVKGTASPETHFQLTVSSIGELKGNWSAAALPADELGKKLCTFLHYDEWPAGRLFTTGKIGGTLDDPDIRFKASIENGSWGNEKFRGSIESYLNKSTMTFSTARIELDRGGQIDASGTISFDENNHWDFHGTGADLALASVFHGMQLPLRAKGTMDASFSLSGTKGNRHAVIQFDGRHDGIGFLAESGKMNGSIVWKENTMDFGRGIHIEFGNGHLNLLEGSQVFLDRNSSGQMHLVLEARNLQKGVLTFFGGAEITGSWEGKNPVVSSDAISVELDVFARALWINHFVLDGNVTHLSLFKDRVEFSPIKGSGQQLSGTVNFTEYPTLKATDLRLIQNGEEQFYLDGFIGANRWDYRLNTKGMDASIFLGLFDVDFPVQGPVDIQATGTGSPNNPNVVAEISWQNGRIGFLPLDIATGRLTLSNGIISVTDILARKKKGYELSGNMKFGTPLTDQGQRQRAEISVRVNDGDLAMVRELWPDCTKSKGSFSGELNLGNPSNGRRLSGFLRLQNMFLRTDSYFTRLEGDVTVSILENKLQIDEGNLRFGKGRAQLLGSIEFSEGEPEHYDLKLITIGDRGLSIRVPELTIPPGPVLGRFNILRRKLAGISRGEPIVNMQLSGPATSPTMAGTVELENTIFTFPPHKNQQREKVNPFIARTLRNFWDRMNWDVIISAGDRTWYQNELVEARVKGSIHLAGSSNDLIVNGRIQTDQGSIVYSGNEFTVNEAVLEVLTQPSAVALTDRNQTFVYLKAAAEKEVFYTDALGNSTEDVIVLELDRALIGEIKPRFRSKNNPNISSEKALEQALGISVPAGNDNALIPSQQPAGQSRTDVDRLLRTSVVQLLDSSLASPLARALARQTGLVDFIRVTYQETDPNDPEPYALGSPNQTNGSDITQNEWLRYVKGTKVRLGRELTNRLFADYSFRVDEYQNQLDLRHEVELAYRVHRNLFLRGTSELDSERTLGRTPERKAILENRWRFGHFKKRKTAAKKEEDPPVRVLSEDPSTQPPR